MIAIMDHVFKEELNIQGVWYLKKKGIVGMIAPYFGEVPHMLNKLQPIGYKHRNLTYTFKHPNKKSILDLISTDEFSEYEIPSFGNDSIGMYFPSRVKTKTFIPGDYSGKVNLPNSLKKYTVNLVLFKNVLSAKKVLKALFNNQDYKVFNDVSYYLR